MNDCGGPGKSYTNDWILTTLVDEHGLDEECSLKLATTGKTACLIVEYTVHSPGCGMGIPVRNNK